MQYLQVCHGTLNKLLPIHRILAVRTAFCKINALLSRVSLSYFTKTEAFTVTMLLFVKSIATTRAIHGRLKLSMENNDVIKQQVRNSCESVRKNIS